MMWKESEIHVKSKSHLFHPIGVITLVIGIWIVPRAQELTREQIDSMLTERRFLTEKDYGVMLKKLGVEHQELRPGANGMDLTAPNAANYEESLANPYPDYPDPLDLTDGRRVSTSREWWLMKRPDIEKQVTTQLYGEVPESAPSISWTTVDSSFKEWNGLGVIVRNLVGTADNSCCPDIEVNIEVELVIPAKADTLVPVIIHFGFKWPPWFNVPEQPEYPAWQLQLLEKGWGFADVLTTSIQEDYGGGLTKGVIGLSKMGKRREPGDWGALRAWAWGASRLVDYMITDRRVDHRRIGITGHSRYGKAAVVAMAYDPRIAIGYISSSGAGGLKPYRRNYGEIVENVAGSGEYHWMVGNFIKYAGPMQWDALPVDAHHLLAMCAPRPVFIGCGKEGDQWTDQKGMYMTAVMASPVYELLGYEGLVSEGYPSLNQELIEGNIAFRQHDQGHTPAPNWDSFIRFASRYFER